MNTKQITRSVAVAVTAAILCLVSDCLGSAQWQEPPEVQFKDEPAARALYKKMTETIRKAETLSYESSLTDVFDGVQQQPWTYRVWMKKPNFFYVETINEDGTKNGILVGDGRFAWSFWPNGRPFFSGEDRGEAHTKYQKTRFNVYMKEPAPGRYSIRYAKILQKSIGPIIMDPSVFQGINSSLEPYMDWIQNRGVEKIAGEDCNVIEVSYANHQRSQYFWISSGDNLPRKLKNVGRANRDSNTQELWSKVTLNAEIPPEKFRWTPPEGWKQWNPPSPEDKLLKPGQRAPDFKLLSVNGGKIKLSDYRGKVVWLAFWRVGCPSCREEMPFLEELYRKHKDKGLIVLGFDYVDDKQIVLDFLHEHSVTFPNILDASDEGVKTGFMTYGATFAPAYYIIDREGKIAAAWGYVENSARGVEVLTKLGLE